MCAHQQSADVDIIISFPSLRSFHCSILFWVVLSVGIQNVNPKNGSFRRFSNISIHSHFFCPFLFFLSLLYPDFSHPSPTPCISLSFLLPFTSSLPLSFTVLPFDLFHILNPWLFLFLFLFSFSSLTSQWCIPLWSESSHWRCWSYGVDAEADSFWRLR